jgi:hypothetical protein
MRHSLFLVLALIVIPHLEAHQVEPDYDALIDSSIDSSVSGSLISEYLSIFDQPIRARRSRSSVDPNLLTNRCASSCANRYKNAVGTRSLVVDRPNDIDREDEDEDDSKENTQLEIICEAARPFVGCFDQCPLSESKRQLSAALEPARFVCLDRYEALRSAMPCIESTKPTVASRCRPECRRYEQSVNKTLALIENPLISFLYTDREVKELIRGLCVFVECSMTCSKPIFRNKCGSETADLMMETVRKVMEAAKVYDRLIYSGTMMPMECDRLITLQ